MRIIAGQFRGRKLKTPVGSSVRPTTGRLRESIFNVITHRLGRFDGIQVADIFAGTGAFGLEALSRGSAEVVFVEKHASLLRQNIDHLAVRNKTRVIPADARALPTQSNPFDLVFMDPPYNKGLIEPTLQSLNEKNWIRSDSLVIVERDEKEDVVFPSFLSQVRVLKQGKRRVHFFIAK